MSRPAITFERYAVIMHMDPCILSGVTVGECGGMTCQDRRQLASDLAMAVQKIDDVLAPHGVSLADKEIDVSATAPYWVPGDHDIMREFKETRVDGVKVVYTGSGCSRIATIALEIGLDACEQYESVERVVKPGLCMTYATDWYAEVDESGITLWTYAHNLALSSGDGTYEEPETIDLIVKTSVPSVVSAVYTSRCTCKAEICKPNGNVTLGDCCWSEVDGVVEFRALATCTCIRGEPIGYRFKAIRRGVSDDALDDAIVSIANYRQAISLCASCNYEAQARLKRDLGITEKGEDIRTKAAPFAFNNGFGIQTPGALAAWATIVAKFGIAGVAGYA